MLTLTPDEAPQTDTGLPTQDYYRTVLLLQQAQNTNKQTVLKKAALMHIKRRCHHTHSNIQPADDR